MLHLRKNEVSQFLLCFDQVSAGVLNFLEVDFGRLVAETGHFKSSDNLFVVHLVLVGHASGVKTDYWLLLGADFEVAGRKFGRTFTLCLWTTSA